MKRLNLKTVKYIGKDCVHYLKDLFKHPISDIELEILEKIFTMGLYSDTAINEACSAALYEKILEVVEFNIILSKINDIFGPSEET